MTTPRVDPIDDDPFADRAVTYGDPKAEWLTPPAEITYEFRLQAVEDATRLMQTMTPGAALDRFDVTELARFLLGVDADGPCGVMSPTRIQGVLSQPCALTAGHRGSHVAADGMTWGAL